MTMKALLLIDEESDKIAIREIEKPSPLGKQVLVKMKAAALNHRDEWCREGRYPGIQYHTVLGSDGAGQVEEIGEEVDQSWIGKNVIINPNINWGDSEKSQAEDYHILGMPTNGTFAEYLMVNVDRLAEKPNHLSFTQAAALPLGGMTAFRAVFTKGEVHEDHKVLVTGIGGGVAQFAFQFALAHGAEVFVTSGDENKLMRAIDMGATGGFYYKDEDWTKAAIKDVGGFDVIIDSAGGSHMNSYLKIIKPGGRIVHYGSTAGLPKSFDIFRLFWSQASIHGSTMGSDGEFTEMIDFVSQNRLVPMVDSVRPFDQIISAFDAIKEGKQFGKLVIEF